MRKYLLFSFIIISIYLFNVNAQQLAFPGAEGYGRFTTGGRGGVVYEVTNLSDAGVGSLRYGIEMSGARTIVFKVSGTIEITKSLQIKNGNLTIAGQTAPGDGICIKAKKLVVPAGAVTALTTISGYSVSVDADNVIIRFLRFRPGDEIDNSVSAPIANIKFENDGLTGRQHKNMIIDHCSMSWAIDEVSSFYDNTNFTMQWCLLGESLYHSFHPKGDHGYGGIWGGMGASFHHNLIADHTSRNPRFCGARYHCVFPQSGCAISLPASTEIVDFRNNVIFNWGGNSAYGGEGGQQNMISNYYKPGPATRKKGGSQLYRLISPSISTDPKVDSVGKWYLSGNYMEGYPAVTSNNAHGSGFQPDNADSVVGLWARVIAPFPFAPVWTQTAQEAYASVLDSCGVFLHRDTVDKRIIYEARTGTAITGGTFGTNTGIIDNPAQVGGWPALHSTEAPTDTDHDGMPDNWETAQGLNPNDATDRNTVGADGYTMLEKYVNNLISARYSLATMVKGGGTVSPGNGSYPVNTTITLTAVPQAGWTFQGWSGDTISSNASIAVNLNKDKNFIATFVVQTYTVSTTVNGSGTVNVSPAASSYSYGSKITITATPSSGYQFTSWSGDTTGTGNPVTITVTKDKTITASFAVISTDVSQLTRNEIKFGCRPNPIKGLAVISFSLPQSAMATICVCNTMGIEVFRKIKRNGKEGLNEIPIDMSGLTSGIYFCKLSIGSQQFIERIVLLNQ